MNVSMHPPMHMHMNTHIHNSRNMACIGCGSARPFHTHGPPLSIIPPPHAISPRFVSPVSPHSHSQAHTPLSASAFSRNASPQRGPTPQTHSHSQSPVNMNMNGNVNGNMGANMNANPNMNPNMGVNGNVNGNMGLNVNVNMGLGPLKPPAPSYPLLTPSGHALSAGGRVRNISSDPMAPCIMYWPDNEPLPDRGQVRPLGSAVLQVCVFV